MTHSAMKPSMMNQPGMNQSEVQASQSYYSYHAFTAGKVGFLLSEKGLQEIDISHLKNSGDADLSGEWQGFAIDIDAGNAQVSDEIKAFVDNVINEFSEYFAGSRQYFSLPLNPSGTDFQKRVWQALIAIPYGEAISYKALAEHIENPKAMRAVGSANGKNPLPIIIPCHRVIQGNQTLGGYSGGIETKIALLRLEGFSFIEGKSGLRVVQGQSELRLE